MFNREIEKAEFVSDFKVDCQDQIVKCFEEKIAQDCNFKFFLMTEFFLVPKCCEEKLVKIERFKLPSREAKI